MFRCAPGMLSLCTLIEFNWNCHKNNNWTFGFRILQRILNYVTRDQVYCTVGKIIDRWPPLRKPFPLFFPFKKEWPKFRPNEHSGKFLPMHDFYKVIDGGSGRYFLAKKIMSLMKPYGFYFKNLISKCWKSDLDIKRQK